MPADLVRRDGVELVRTGSWQIESGRWDASREDLAHAVAALQCPAVRKPVLWIGHTDDRFTPRSATDGEPGVGWVENLRLGDGGHTLVGDYMGMPAWLDQVLASAYPDRSVEGSYNRRCQLGHTHPFVLDGVALLGVTRPGVGTLRSLQSLDDVRDLYGLTASAEIGGEVRIAASIPGVHAAAEVQTGAMVALIPTEADAERLAVEGGEPADRLHATLAYLGDAVDLSAEDRQDLIDTVSSAVNGAPVIDADVFALSAFNPGTASDRDTALVLGLSGDILDAIHSLVADALHAVEVMLPRQHAPWHGHVTVAYSDDLSRLAGLVDRVGPVRFDRIRIALAGQTIDIPLIEPEPDDEADDDEQVAAAAAGDGNALKRYWLGKGLKRWATKRHPWTALYRQLRKHVGSERAKRIASQWFHDHFGYWPGDRRHRKRNASAGDAGRAEQVARAFHESYERQAPEHGYETREDSAKPWNEVPENNRALMVAVVSDLIDRGVISVQGDGSNFTFKASVLSPERLRDLIRANASGGADVPNPSPNTAERIRTAWNESAPHDQWIVEVHDGYAIVTSETDRTFARVPVEVADDGVTFGQPVAVRPGYVDAGDQPVAASAVYASRGESRPDPDAPTAGPADDLAVPPVVDDETPPADPEADPELPAAEPETNTEPEPEEEVDPVSTLSTDVRSRLGLPEDADDAAVLAALDSVKAKADTPPAPEPDEEQIAAAAEQVTKLSALETKVEILNERLVAATAELDTTRAEKADAEKRRVLGGGRADGKFPPSDYDKWSARYDKNPEVVTEVLASIPVGAAVPVNPAGYTDSGEPTGDDGGEFDSLFSTPAPKGA